MLLRGALALKVCLAVARRFGVCMTLSSHQMVHVVYFRWGRRTCKQQPVTAAVDIYALLNWFHIASPAGSTNDLLYLVCARVMRTPYVLARCVDCLAFIFYTALLIAFRSRAVMCLWKPQGLDSARFNSVI